jgi:hypothetical protein
MTLLGESGRHAFPDTMYLRGVFEFVRVPDSEESLRFPGSELLDTCSEYWNSGDEPCPSGTSYVGDSFMKLIDSKSGKLCVCFADSGPQQVGRFRLFSIGGNSAGFYYAEGTMLVFLRKIK